MRRCSYILRAVSVGVFAQSLVGFSSVLDSREVFISSGVHQVQFFPQLWQSLAVVKVKRTITTFASNIAIWKWGISRAKCVSISKQCLIALFLLGVSKSGCWQEAGELTGLCDPISALISSSHSMSSSSGSSSVSSVAILGSSSVVSTFIGA